MWNVHRFCKGQNSKSIAFKTFWLGETISLLGSQLSIVALPIIALQGLGLSTSQYVSLFTSVALVNIILGIISGLVCDLQRSTTVMLVSVAARISCVFLIVQIFANGHLTLLVLAVLLTLDRSARILFDSAVNVFIYDTQKDDILSATSKIAISQSFTSIVGAAVAGLVITEITIPNAMYLDCISYAIFFCLILFIRNSVGIPLGTGHKETFLQRFRLGLTAIWEDSKLRALLYLGGNWCLFSAAFELLSSVIYVKYLGFNAQELSIQFSLMGGGMFIGNLTLVRLKSSAVVQPRNLYIAQFAGYFIGVLFVAFYFFGCKNAWAFGVISFLLGLIYATRNALSITLRQENIPLNMSGRINSVFSSLIWIIYPLVGILVSPASAWIDAPNILFLVSVAAIVLSLVRTLFVTSTQEQPC
ncbi:MFS transporter [Chitinimonas sp. BJB300]|uniref:MFS transporter n=1 Tax=Chitinimonas sp. BJB300 TaxID=1559339 RepID=UPI000C12373D|nr:MFS transporter [Chitinimonas sp. BJB300]TSJ84529.1 MFS transporter [Chitinimonas sp. BJB300]